MIPRHDKRELFLGQMIECQSRSPLEECIYSFHVRPQPLKYLRAALASRESMFLLALGNYPHATWTSPASGALGSQWFNDGLMNRRPNRRLFLPLILGLPFQNSMCHIGIGLCAETCRVNTFLLRPMWSFSREKRSFIWHFHLNFDSTTWNDYLHDLHLLTERDNSNLIQHPKLSVELEVPAMNPRTLGLGYSSHVLLIAKVANFAALLAAVLFLKPTKYLRLLLCCHLIMFAVYAMLLWRTWNHILSIPVGNHAWIGRHFIWHARHIGFKRMISERVGTWQLDVFWRP